MLPERKMTAIRSRCGQRGTPVELSWWNARPPRMSAVSKVSALIVAASALPHPRQINSRFHHGRMRKGTLEVMSTTPPSL